MSSAPKLDPAQALHEGSPPEPVLAFSAKRLRVQVTFTPQHCLQSEAPPSHLMDRARAKLLAAKRNGQAAIITCYEKRFTKAWAKLRELAANGAAAPQSITMVLASGAPPLPGLLIKVPDDDDDETLALISIDPATPALADWQLEWLALHVRKSTRLAGVKGAANPTQLHGVLLRAQAGEVVRNVELMPETRTCGKDQQPFYLGANRARGEVSLVICDLSVVANLQRVEERIARTEESIAKLKTSSRGSYKILRQEILQAVEAAIHGPERLGIGLPLTILAALNFARPGAAAAPSAAQSTKPSESPHRPLVAVQASHRLTVNVSADRMTANIVALVSSGAALPGSLSEEWLKAELAAAGVTHGVRVDALAELKQKLDAGVTPAGLVLAVGSQPVSASKPFLSLTARSRDTRAYSRKNLVRAGDQIAEVQYEIPAREGMDVTGKHIAPPPGEKFANVSLGEGVASRDGQKFFALVSGLVVQEGAVLRLDKALIHEGDANLATGDIVFDGPVEITGSIASGTKVKAGGDLFVHGEINGRVVECAGSITVKRGIVVGQSGLVRAKGNIKADFIENSTIICGGDLTIGRSVIQSTVMVQGTITLNSPAAVIGGGVIVCGGDLKTKNLGLPAGVRTQIKAGVDFRAGLTVELRTKRLASLTRQAEDERQTFRVIMQTHPSRLSKAEKASKDHLRGRVQRWSAILEAAQRYLDVATARLKYNADAKLYVAGILSANCTIQLGGKIIPINEVANVVVTSVAHEGSYLRVYS